MAQRKNIAGAEGAGSDYPERVSGVTTIRSEDLLRGGRELRILHDREVYRLIVTRNNRLILQK